MGPSPLEEFGDVAVDAMANAKWYEARIEVRPSDFYRWIETEFAGSVLLHHHFYEPWHTTGAVVRLLVVEDQQDEVAAEIGAWQGVLEVGPWEREDDDLRLFGAGYFVHAMTFFQGSSRLADHPDGEYITRKLIHCVLNARRMTRRQESRLMFEFAWKSLITEPVLWWRALRSGKKWWER